MLTHTTLYIYYIYIIKNVLQPLDRQTQKKLIVKISQNSGFFSAKMCTPECWRSTTANCVCVCVCVLQSSLDLKPGANEMVFSITTKFQVNFLDSPSRKSQHFLHAKLVEIFIIQLQMNKVFPVYSMHCCVTVRVHSCSIPLSLYNVPGDDQGSVHSVPVGLSRQGCDIRH